MDGEEIKNQTEPITGSAIEPSDTLFIGGYPFHHNITDITETDFDGCIDNVVIIGTPVDLSQNIQAYDVIPGCPVKVIPLLFYLFIHLN